MDGGWMDRWMDRRTEGGIDKWREEGTERGMDGQTDRLER